MVVGTRTHTRTGCGSMTDVVISVGVNPMAKLIFLLSVVALTQALICIAAYSVIDAIRYREWPMAVIIFSMTGIMIIQCLKMSWGI